MPVINGEASYEMLMDSIPASKTRAMFWLCMMNGAAGHTYGANGIWQMNRKEMPHGASPTPGSTGYGSIAWDEAVHLDGGRQIAAGKRWLEKLAWWTLHPHFSWVVWGGSDCSEIAPCAIGITNGPRVFYMLHDRPVILRQLNLGLTYAVTHFNPVETTESDGGTFTADRNGETRLAAPGHGHDWVVLIRPVGARPIRVR